MRVYQLQVWSCKERRAFDLHHFYYVDTTLLPQLNPPITWSATTLDCVLFIFTFISKRISYLEGKTILTCHSILSREAVNLQFLAEPLSRGSFFAARSSSFIRYDKTVTSDDDVRFVTFPRNDHWEFLESENSFVSANAFARCTYLTQNTTLLGLGYQVNITDTTNNLLVLRNIFTGGYGLYSRCVFTLGVTVKRVIIEYKRKVSDRILIKPWLIVFINFWV